MQKPAPERMRIETTMKRLRRNEQEERMDAEAFAGFLRLWIAPPSRELRPSPEVEAYLRHVAERSPLSPVARRALAETTDRAA